MDLGIQAIWRRPPDARGDQRDPGRGVDGRLVFRQNDQRGPDWFSRGSMPLVIFTPRLSVSRMCTPSVMSFAASVRLISSVISSSDGNR